MSQRLLMEQKELARLSLSPYQEQEWVRNKIYPKWEKLFRRPAFGIVGNQISSGSAFKVHCVPE